MNPGSFPRSGLRREPGFPHILVLGVCLAMLAGALLLAPAEGGQGLALAGLRLPKTCSFEARTAVRCPGCGLTRSWVHAARGHLRTSLTYHRLGWAVMLYVVLQALRHGLWLALPGVRKRVELWGHRLDLGLIALTLALLINWLPTLANDLGWIG